MGKNTSNTKLALHLENALRTTPDLEMPSAYLEAWVQDAAGLPDINQDVKDRMK